MTPKTRLAEMKTPAARTPGIFRLLRGFREDFLADSRGFGIFKKHRLPDVLVRAGKSTKSSLANEKLDLRVNFQFSSSSALKN